MASTAAALEPLRPALRHCLALIRDWFGRMVDPDTQRLYYKYIPHRDSHLHESSPIRDLGTCYDLATLQRFSGGSAFDPAINATLSHYIRMLLRERTFEEEGVATAEGLGGTETEAEVGDKPLPRAWLSSAHLGEPSSVAHSAMLLMSLVAHERYPDEDEKEALLGELAAGIIHQQRSDGGFEVYFEPAPLPDSGWELYWGEAALALALTYGRLGDEQLLKSAHRALTACELRYISGCVGRNSLVFFANWQCQAARAVLRHTTHAAVAGHMAIYMYTLQDDIISGGQLVNSLVSAPEAAATVEVACALEGLAVTYAIALQGTGEPEQQRIESYEAAIAAAVGFLQRVQRTPGERVPPSAVGGFGHGLRLDVQRVDVTSHVCSAYIKLLELAGDGIAG